MQPKTKEIAIDKLNAIKLIVLLKKMEDKNIINILGFDIPYYFKNKIRKNYR